MDSEPSYVIGVDLGGTKTAAALVAPDGSTHCLRSAPTPALEGPPVILDNLAALIRDAVEDARRAGLGGGESIGAVGVGAAGVVDTRTGTILSSTDALTAWAGTAVAEELRRRLITVLGREIPVHVENDVDAHAVGEVWLGAAAGAPSALMVAVGTGVGGSLILGGVPWRGAHNAAGEIGHMPTPGAESMRCSCGRMGHLEALGSGPALHRRYRHLGGDPTSVDARDVVARASMGDEIAVTAVRESAKAVGRATAALVTALDPAVVVIGGGMAKAGQLWWQTMEQTLVAELVDVLAGVTVVPAKLGRKAAIIGAARSAWHMLGRTV